MQTFVPLPNIVASAQTLDSRRLGKQIIECRQILRSNNEPTYGWRNHPAVKMWRGHDAALFAYQWACHVEWGRRYTSHQSFANTQIDRPDLAEQMTHTPRDLWDRSDQPVWWGDPAVHRSHRLKLLDKDLHHYTQFFDDEPVADPEYIWPTETAHA